MELLANNVLERAVKANLVKLNDLKYTEEEQKFAARIQSTLTDPPPLDSITRVTDTANSVSMGSTPGWLTLPSTLDPSSFTACLPLKKLVNLPSAE